MFIINFNFVKLLIRLFYWIFFYFVVLIIFFSVSYKLYIKITSVILVSIIRWGREIKGMILVKEEVECYFYKYNCYWYIWNSLKVLEKMFFYW